MKHVLLVIDDDERMLSLISAVCRLSLPDVHCVTAMDGTRGLQLARSENPGVVVLDIKLPDINGFEVCRRIRADPVTANSHILMISGVLLEAKDRIRGIENGADNYLFKPFDPEELVLQIRALFRWWDAEQAQLEKLEKLVAQRTKALAEANEILQKEITERKQAEAENQRLAMAVEQAAETIVITDTQGTMLYVNPAFETSTGYTRREALGQNPRILKSGKHDAAFYQRLWATLTRGEIWHGHVSNKRKDGALYEEEATISPIRNAAGVLTNYVAIKLDVTRERKLEEQIQQAQKMESVGQLAGGVAHDFNNILQSIMGFTEILLEEIPSDTKQHDEVLEIQKAADRAAGLTRQLLAFSRRQMIVTAVLDLNDVVSNMHRMLHRLIGEDIQLVTKLAADLHRIKADAGQMEQVIMNLAVNARDAMPHGGRITIATDNVTLTEDDTYITTEARAGMFVRLTISDTGQGIAPDVLPHIFEPFFSTKGPGKGTGLGLSVIYGIAQQNKGWVHVYNQLGLGVAFKIYLPAYTDTDEPASTVARAQSAPPRGHGERILVLEDEPEIRQLAERVLRTAGYEVHVAATAGEGCARFAQEDGRFDLVFSDVVLPDQNGIITIEQFLQKKPSLAVLLCSGYTDERSHWHTITEKNIRFLQKPYPAAELLRAVHAVLAARPAPSP